MAVEQSRITAINFLMGQTLYQINMDQVLFQLRYCQGYLVGQIQDGFRVWNFQRKKAKENETAFRKRNVKKPKKRRKKCVQNLLQD